MSALDTVTAYVLIYGSVLFAIFLLLNFAIGVVFISYSVIKPLTLKQMKEDMRNLGNLRVSSLPRFPGFFLLSLAYFGVFAACFRCPTCRAVIHGP